MNGKINIYEILMDAYTVLCLLIEKLQHWSERQYIRFLKKLKPLAVAHRHSQTKKGA